MNIFSSDIFLNTLADVCFPGRQRSIEIFRVAGKYFRLLVIDGKQVITRWPFLDFVEPVEMPRTGPVKELNFIPHAVLQTTPPVRERTGEIDADAQPAPFIDWSLFSDWEAFESSVATRRSNLKRESLRKHRGLENSLGRISVVLTDPRPEVFDRCVQWKSAQYLRTGLRDLFADRDNVRLFRELQRKEVVIVSSISAGEQLLAVHFGALVDKTFYSWIAAYDPEHSRYSPGALLLEALLAESWRRQDAEFNFLIGDQEYKWFYATHSRAIGALGSVPWSLRLTNAAKRPIKRSLAAHPKLLLLARKLIRRLER